jgi:hypothetical protein
MRANLKHCRRAPRDRSLTEFWTARRLITTLSGLPGGSFCAAWQSQTSYRAQNINGARPLLLVTRVTEDGSRWLIPSK